MSDQIVEPVVPVTPAAVVPAAATAPAVEPAPVTPKEAPAEPAAPAKENTLLGDDPTAEKPAVEGEVKEPAAAKVVPEKYELKMPEGMQVDTALLDAVTPIFKEAGITQEVAQKLADAYAPVIQKAGQAQHEAAMAAFDKQIEDWGKETKAMLGPDAAKEMAPAGRLIQTFAGKDAPALRQLLNDTGLGNHPLMVKFLIAAGKAISQDKFVDGGNMPGDNSEAAVTKRLYPNSVK